MHACVDMQTEISHINFFHILIWSFSIKFISRTFFFPLKIIEKLQCMSYLGACDACINILLLLLVIAFVKNVVYLICQLWLQNFRSLPCLYTRPLYYALVVFLKKWARIKNDIPINNVILCFFDCASS